MIKEKCKICGENSSFFANGVVLGKYDIIYYRCPHCGFIQTEEPYWLEESYLSAINDFDIGLISRNMHLNKKISTILKGCFHKSKKFLDYGAGYGMFVRMMRDSGFDFSWYDKYCENLFAKNFEKKEKSYDVLTAFELFEHFDNPKAEIEKMLSISPNIIFTTLLLPESNPKPTEWWYYVPETGQHISFYTEKSLKILAETYGKHYVGINDLHIFSENKISFIYLKIITSFSALLNRIVRKKGLLASDYKIVTGKNLE